MKYPKFEKYIYQAFDRLWLWWPEKALLRKLWPKNPAGQVLCIKCNRYFFKQETQVDHKKPKKPIKGPVRLADGWLDLNELRSSYFVDLTELQILCKNCHKEKTNAENRERRRNKARRGKNGLKSN